MFIKLHRLSDGQEYLLNGAKVLAIFPQEGGGTLLDVGHSEPSHYVKESIPQILEQIYRKG